MLGAAQLQQAELYARKALAIAEALAASDITNIQARHDLAHAYTKMGNSISRESPAEATAWYRRAISLTKELTPHSDAQRELAGRDELLAAVLLTPAQASERLHLLQDANSIRQEIAKTGPNPPADRVRLMRSYCRLSSAELAMNQMADA